MAKILPMYANFFKMKMIHIKTGVCKICFMPSEKTKCDTMVLLEHYHKDIGLLTKKEPKSAGRVGLSVQDEYPGRHTNCPLSTDLGILFPKKVPKFRKPGKWSL